MHCPGKVSHGQSSPTFITDLTHWPLVVLLLRGVDRGTIGQVRPSSFSHGWSLLYLSQCSRCPLLQYTVHAGFSSPNHAQSSFKLSYDSSCSHHYGEYSFSYLIVIALSSSTSFFYSSWKDLPFLIPIIVELSLSQSCYRSSSSSITTAGLLLIIMIDHHHVRSSSIFTYCHQNLPLIFCECEFICDLAADLRTYNILKTPIWIIRQQAIEQRACRHHSYHSFMFRTVWRFHF